MSWFYRRKDPVRLSWGPYDHKKLSCMDCKPFMDKVLGRIASWKSKFLSYVGRLVLIKSVLFSVQIYWASIFMLPAKVLNEIDATLMAFFLSGIDLNKKEARVAWDEVCSPNVEGGLGLVCYKEWNKSTLSRHIWDICCNGNSSLWVDWIMAYRLKKDSLWVAKCMGNMLWC